MIDLSPTTTPTKREKMSDSLYKMMDDVADSSAELFEEMLDELYPAFKIGELTFYASQILKACDPIAYRIELTDYMNDLGDQLSE
jgi:hypothetical protein